VHPIERLRFVARAQGADAESLVREMAGALRGLGLDPAGLVVACRRIVERHPSCGALWWLCARMLTSGDAHGASRDAVAAIECDPTVERLAAALPDDATVATIGWPDLTGDALGRRGDVRVLAVDAGYHGSAFVQRLERVDVECELVPAEAAGLAVAAADVVLVEADAADGRRLVGPTGSRVLAAVARSVDRPVWGVVGRGRRLPTPMLDALVAAVADPDEPWAAESEVVPTDLLTHVAGPDGLTQVTGAALQAECDVAPELLRPT